MKKKSFKEFVDSNLFKKIEEQNLINGSADYTDMEVAAHLYEEYLND